MIKQQRERRVISYQDIVDKAIELIGDKNKALAWYMNKAPRYGNMSPHEVCKAGGFRQIMKDLENYAF